MLSRQHEKVMTEHELGHEADKLLRENKNVFVLCSSTNIDTIAEFYHAAAKNNKPFIVCEDDFQNEILRIATQSSKSNFYDFTKPKAYNYGEQLHKLMGEKGFCFIGRTNIITQKAMSFFKDNLLVYSMWKGYLDKKHLAFDEYKSDWLDKAKANGSRVIDLHTSGHAIAGQIKQVCEITDAKVILPIHSESPEAFLKLGINATIRILHDGEEIYGEEI
ncbi:MAG: hypothetical protein FWE84_04495, partial [Firmicutes bacterium]|nr:hypothetical protein [Bacillota bacterium]